MTAGPLDEVTVSSTPSPFEPRNKAIPSGHDMRAESVVCDATGRCRRMRRGLNSQVVEREQLRNAAKDHEHGNSKVHHATRHRQPLLHKYRTPGAIASA
jgi:hypothetical protein